MHTDDDDDNNNAADAAAAVAEHRQAKASSIVVGIALSAVSSPRHPAAALEAPPLPLSLPLAANH
jgi:hypothetical protein